MPVLCQRVGLACGVRVRRATHARTQAGYSTGRCVRAFPRVPQVRRHVLPRGEQGAGQSTKLPPSLRAPAGSGRLLSTR
jgi:hypothetical protein